MNEFVMNAKRFALDYHGDQKYGDLPYRFHLQQVYDTLFIYYPESHKLLAAAWLHDVIEDTECTLDEVRDRFGGTVARIVDGCTDCHGRNRKERKLRTNKKLERAHDTVKVVKIADRLCNMRCSIENSKLRKMYIKEYPDFYTAVKDINRLGLLIHLNNIFISALKAEENENTDSLK